MVNFPTLTNTLDKNLTIGFIGTLAWQRWFVSIIPKALRDAIQAADFSVTRLALSAAGDGLAETSQANICQGLVACFRQLG